MEQTITCINCPMGCRMTVTIEDGQVTSVTGNTCKRGERYAHQECIAPERMVTAVIVVGNRSMPLSVKTRTPIPKKLIHACMTELSKVTIAAPIKAGDVVLADVCGTGVDVIATKNID
jgi:CxxC motif-containing protein